ncbi:hypothetical protein C2S51_009626 [Perilla frutescens var. frutescens]|nr:hypothetical protein C2S51_009626 [Perilla frutescens var. frutescens]
MHICRALQNVFADYLYTEGLKARSGTVRCAYLARLDMNWRDIENNNYCGVYTMRHMETYMGQSSKAWNCNLEKGNVSQMNVLCMEYCASILSSSLNDKASSIERNTKSIFVANSKKKHTTVNAVLSGDV